MRWLFLPMMLALPASAETVVAARTIRANTVLTAADVAISPAELASGFMRASDVVGQETRVVLYAGRPIGLDDIGPPALVDRNQIVRLHYTGGGLSIATEGRALERGGIGDRVRVMNLDSRATVFGQVEADGSIRVTR